MSRDELGRLITRLFCLQGQRAQLTRRVRTGRMDCAAARLVWEANAAEVAKIRRQFVEGGVAVTVAEPARPEWMGARAAASQVA